MRLLFLCLALALLGGNTVGCVHRPQVALQNVELFRLSHRGGTLLLTLEVHNPNAFALDAERMNYVLELEDSGGRGDEHWVEFASGSYDAPFSVAAGRSETLQLPVDFDYSQLGSVTGSLLLTQKVDYRARGTVLLHTPLGTHEVPIKKQGTLGRK